MNFTSIAFDIKDSIGKITLNRPDHGNSMNASMIQDLMNVSLVCSENREIRVVVITGAGRFFCGGGDLFAFGKEKDLKGFIRHQATTLHTAMSRFARMKKPLIAAVNGPAAGAGFSLVCASDLAIACESSRFTMAYTRAGLTPDGSSTFFLPRIVGLKRAMELTLLNRALSSKEALEWGIVSRVVPDAELENSVMEIATQLVAGPMEALGRSKRLLREGWNESLETQMERESEEISEISQTTDATEGIRAFVEKRSPRFGK